MERNHRESPFYHQSGPLKSRPAANNRSALPPVSSDFIMESRIEAAYRARQKKKLKLDQFQSEPGELIATSSDGSQWYIIMLSDRVRDRQCVINHRICLLSRR